MIGEKVWYLGSIWTVVKKSRDGLSLNLKRGGGMMIWAPYGEVRLAFS